MGTINVCLTKQLIHLRRTFVQHLQLVTRFIVRTGFGFGVNGMFRHSGVHSCSASEGCLTSSEEIE